MTVTRQCPFCGKGLLVDIPDEAYQKICNGELIQNAWPEASATQREILISGLCPACQDEVFNGSEE